MDTYSDADETLSLPNEKGGTFLVIADESQEFKAALQYACKAAKVNRGHVGILLVVDNQDFQQWNMVEARMKKELRLQAEKSIWNFAKASYEINGIVPALYISEGDKYKVLADILENDTTIVQLILGGGVTGSSPGPIINYFLTKGIDRLKVPMVIVPAHN